MHLTLLPTLPATSLPPPPITEVIGLAVARTVVAYAGAVVEQLEHGSAGEPVKIKAAKQLTALFFLRQDTLDTLDFFETARVHGKLTLREHCDPRTTDAVIESTIDDVLRVLDRVITAQLH